MSRQAGILSETLDKFLFEETLTGEQRSTIRNQIGVAASLGSVADAAGHYQLLSASFAGFPTYA